MSHLAKSGDCRVRCSGVAPCNLFLIILRKSGGNAKVDANVLGVSGMGLASGTHEGCRVELVLAGNADPSLSETLSLPVTLVVE